MKCITSKIDLCGPIAGTVPYRKMLPGDDYWTPGICVTASTYQFQFQLPHARIQSAIWRVCWSVVSPAGKFNPNGGRYINRLVHADNGPANKVAFAYIDSNDNPPAAERHNRSVDITSQMEALRCAGVFKNVIWEVAGDNTNYVEFMSSWIEIVWDFDC